MCEELQVGDLLYCISSDFFDILEVEQVIRPSLKTIGEYYSMFVSTISRITSKKYVFYLPRDIKERHFVVKGLHTVTCNESIAVALYSENVNKTKK